MHETYNIMQLNLKARLDREIASAVTFHLGHKNWEPIQVINRCEIKHEDEGQNVFAMDGIKLLRIFTNNPHGDEGCSGYRHIRKLYQKIERLY